MNERASDRPSHRFAGAGFAFAAAAVPLLCWLAALLFYFGSLLNPDLTLTARDIPFFHLPLRTALERLAGFGLPQWNPWIHGGQPILSNPNYAAFYPSTWLLLVLSPAYSLNWNVLLHAAWGGWGAWKLARHLGCGRSGAALAALGFAVGPTFVSLVHTFTILCGFAWLPWVVLFGDRSVSADSAFDRRRAAILAGGALAGALLAGEPVTALVAFLALAAFASAAARRRPQALRDLLLIGLFASGLAAVQSRRPQCGCSTPDAAKAST